MYSDFQVASKFVKTLQNCKSWYLVREQDTNFCNSD